MKKDPYIVSIVYYRHTLFIFKVHTLFLRVFGTKELLFYFGVMISC